MERLPSITHRRLMALIKAAVVQTFNDHADMFQDNVTTRRLEHISNSIAKRAVGAIKTELRSQRGTGD